MLLLISQYIFILLVCVNVKVRDTETMISPVVMHECESWSVTLEREHVLRLM